MRFRALFAVIAVVLLAACGESPTAPATPDATTTAAFGSGLIGTDL
jgi:hypothetical protein